MDAQEQLKQLISEEWQERLREDPLFATMVGEDAYNDRLSEVSAEAADRRAQVWKDFQARLGAIDRAALPESERLNYVLFARELQEKIDAHGFGEHLMPLAKLTGPHSLLPDVVLQTPFRHVGDYEAYIRRLQGMRVYLEGIVGLMRVGMERGLVPARVALSGIEESFYALTGADVDASVFFTPFTAFPSTIPAESRAALAQEGRAAIRGSVIPGFNDMLEFVEKEYLPAARESIAASDLPQGPQYYAFVVRKFTTLTVTPQQVHAIGHDEVRRIRAEMQVVMSGTGFQGTFHAFIRFLRTDPRFYVSNPDDLMKEVALLMKRMDGELPRLFSVLPRTPYGLRETPAHIAPRSTSAYYFPATGDGTTAGYYYVNTYDLPSRPLYEYEALSFHEAVPGHHLQLALQQEMESVPEFRRYSQVDAFIEGWALYAERLGLEVGFYTDPYRNFGRLIYEMWRACRLVVDTGMHAMGWTRQQAVDYMAENTALSLLNIENEVDRYIAWPGQALAYKMGEITIRKLRAAAEHALGSRFDVREFHRVLLENGAVPLDLMEKKIRQTFA
jgi:uncharacterized protein (DUF885 family)